MPIRKGGNAVTTQLCGPRSTLTFLSKLQRFPDKQTTPALIKVQILPPLLIDTSSAVYHFCDL